MWSGLISRVPPPSLDDCLNELLREEQWQLTQAKLEQKPTKEINIIAFVAKGQPLNHDIKV